MGAKSVGIAFAPAVIDVQVASDGPAQLLQSLYKHRQTALHLGVIRTKIREHADPPQAIGLLRARRERPRRRAAESHDERAPPHSITSSARAMRSVESSG